MSGKIRTGDIPNTTQKHCRFSWTTQCMHSTAVALLSLHSDVMNGCSVCYSFWRPGC